MRKYIPVFCFVLLCLSAIGQPKPNIILILADDVTLKTLHIDGGPAFLKTPNLNKIGNEGIRFKNSFVTFSLCEPSRAQLLTGYYPHITGIKTGGVTSEIPASYYTLPEIVHDNGYRTALVGKYQLGYASNQRPGWDYWFSFQGGIASPVNSGYFDTQCNINGTDTFLAGHMTDLINQYSLDFLNTLPDTAQPFFLVISHAAAHRPFEPQTQYDHLYDSSYVSLPSNFYKFENDYPSYLYPYNQCTATPSRLKKLLRNYYELVKGIDAATKNIIDWLNIHNKLSNTMLIYSSDNGIFFGEHLLADKSLEYDESIKVPLAIRYPAWFPVSGQTDSTHLALNLDLFSTVLDAAGISDTFNTGGISINKLVNNTQERNCFMYEFLKSGNKVPHIRCVRTINYMYSKSYCSTPVEEFFDLAADPHQNTNLINDSSYLSLIDQFRLKLDSIRLALNDTAILPLGNCSLIHHIIPPSSPSGQKMESANSFEMDFNKWLIWFDDDYSQMSFIIKSPTEQKIAASLFTISGQLIKSLNYVNSSGMDEQKMDVSKFPTGIYILKITEENKPLSIKFSLVH